MAILSVFGLISIIRVSVAYLIKQLFPNIMDWSILPENEDEDFESTEVDTMSGGYTLDHAFSSGSPGSRFKRKLGKKDMTDTVVTHSIAYDDEEWERNFIVPTQPDSHAVKLPVRKDDTCYKMDHKERGKCVIFNHDEFDPGVAHPRKGSKADVEAIHRTFKKLNFTVEEHRNCSYWEIQNIIRELAKDDHVDRDCICIFMLTHGTDKGYIYAKDDSYSLTEIWKPFTADKCSSLAGKPKLFFFQACRGNQLDSGITAFTAQSFRMSETDSTDSPFYKIPTHADFLLAYSTMEGFFSWRDTEEGTWYIQCLCDVIERNWRKYDLSKMLTITARIIANDYSSSHENPVKNNQKQMPSLTSTLTRDVIFLPKNNY